MLDRMSPQVRRLTLDVASRVTRMVYQEGESWGIIAKHPVNNSRIVGMRTFF
jgi:hypothetical protein